VCKPASTLKLLEGFRRIRILGSPPFFFVAAHCNFYEARVFIQHLLNVCINVGAAICHGAAG